MISQSPAYPVSWRYYEAQERVWRHCQDRKIHYSGSNSRTTTSDNNLILHRPCPFYPHLRPRRYKHFIGPILCNIVIINQGLLSSQIVAKYFSYLSSLVSPVCRQGPARDVRRGVADTWHVMAMTVRQLLHSSESCLIIKKCFVHFNPDIVNWGQTSILVKDV